MKVSSFIVLSSVLIFIVFGLSVIATGFFTAITCVNFEKRLQRS